MPTTSEILLEWDRRRVRSQQPNLGWSEVGVCQRRAGYRLAHTPPSNPSGSVQAVLGTAIDEAVNSVVRDTLSVQQEVTFAGIVGHYDRVEEHPATDDRPAWAEVVDVKSVGTDRWLEHIEMHGPPEHNLFQVHPYAAGLIAQRQGDKTQTQITHVRIDYIARDTGREAMYRDRFSPRIVANALEWVRRVKNAPLEMLPRAFEPTSQMCRSCPFQRVCWPPQALDRDPRAVVLAEGADVGALADELFDTRTKIKEMQRRADELRGILDGIRPEGFGKLPLVRAGTRLVEFRPLKSGAYSLNFRPESAITRGGGPRAD